MRKLQSSLRKLDITRHLIGLYRLSLYDFLSAASHPKSESVRDNDPKSSVTIESKNFQKIAELTKVNI